MKLNDLKPNFIYIKKIIRFGIPASVSQATVAIGFIILNSFVNTYGEFTLAAFGIGNMISSIIIMPAMGIGGAVSAIVGQNIGNNNIIRARECVYKSSILGIVISIIGTTILFRGAEKIVEMFSEQKEILKLGTTYLKFTSLSIIGLAISPIITGAFQGAGQIKKAMYLNMFRLWGLRLPLLFALPYFMGKSETVIWSAMTSSNLITMFICLYFYKRSNFQPVNKTLLVKY